ncbi:MAG: sigma-54 dependent transcriptional regulator [Desulfobacteraceae bacterium]|nr:sigma-54 dependent transcriptional regulator [Desulfobacteraceae bacterium]
MMPDKPELLIVDDEPSILANCEKILGKLNFNITTAANGLEALTYLKARSFDVVITDLKMSRMGGMAVLDHIREHRPEIRVVVMTGFSSVASAVEVMKSGAFDYLPKPFTPDELRSVTLQALENSATGRRNRQLMDSPSPIKAVSHQLVGTSDKIRKVVTMIEKVAPTDSTVLICGESGTGKELVARAVHANSSRRDKVFFALDCGTLSKTLLESELFGYRKGAFTGADRDKEGIFSMADSGTVFLDEIGNIDREIQGKLLRFLENREFIEIGGNQPRKVNIRLIFATNRNLQDMVDEGSFREDFYYRIFVYPILIPPLRERRTDIPSIAYFFLNQFSETMGKRIKGFSDDAMQRLSRHDWPGNIRQLRNVIERAVILADHEEITPKDMALSWESNEVEQMLDMVPETNEEFKKLKKEIREKAVIRIEKNFLLNALTKNKGNVTRAAKNAGLQRSNFQNLMKKHGIKKSSR